MNYLTIVPPHGGIAKAFGSSFIRYRPQILAGIGVASFMGATVLAVKATPKALDKLEKRKEELRVKKLPTTEVVKTAGPCYIPAVVATAVGVASIASADHEMRSRVADISALAATTESMLQAHRDAVQQELGERKAEKIDAAAAQKIVDQNPPPKSKDDIIVTGFGDQLVYDPVYTGRYFYCDIEKIMRAQNVIVSDITRGLEPYASTEDFFGEFNMANYLPEAVRDMGWNDKNLPDIRFYDPIAEVFCEKAPVLVMDYDRHPAKFDYREF